MMNLFIPILTVDAPELPSRHEHQLGIITIIVVGVVLQHLLQTAVIYMTTSRITNSSDDQELRWVCMMWDADVKTQDAALPRMMMSAIPYTANTAQ